MHSLKRLCAAVISAAGLLSLSVAVLPTASQAQTVLKLGHVAPPGSAYQIAAERLNADLKKVSGGKMQLEIVHSGVLGNMPQHWAQLMAGSLDIHMIDISAIQVIPNAKLFSVTNMPYMFRDQKHFRAYLDSDVFKEMMAGVEKADGIRYVGYLGDRPARALTTKNRRVMSMADMKGLKVRVPEVKSFGDTFRAFGASPTPVKQSDLFMALQSGLVDGQDNGIIDVVAFGLTEVQKYYIPIDYVHSGFAIWINGAKWNSLSAEQQGWLAEARRLAEQEGNVAYPAELEQAIAKAKAKGMEFVQVDRSGFEKAALPIVQALDGVDWPKGLAERIRSIR